uniref:hypothetical protein n=1 Tax=Streptomyces sp. MSC1_001 TaxID=2909263 RepID=UPI0020308260
MTDPNRPTDPHGPNDPNNVHRPNDVNHPNHPGRTVTLCGPEHLRLLSHDPHAARHVRFVPEA